VGIFSLSKNILFNEIEQSIDKIYKICYDIIILSPLKINENGGNTNEIIKTSSASVHHAHFE